MSAKTCSATAWPRCWPSAWTSSNGESRAAARERAWALAGDAAPGADGGLVTVDLDATIVIAHSEKHEATPTWKKTFGFHSLGCLRYSSASLRERIYLGTPSSPAAGVLISTAASDSEGTLGGLVTLGERRYLERILRQALDDAAHCSSDPLCAEHVPEYSSAVLHNAACHACLFASETSCESGNRWLDRAVLADLTGDGFAFPLR